MKKIIFLICFFSIWSFAQQSGYILGLRSSKYGQVGYENASQWGVILENSIFIEDVELQYLRIEAFHDFSIMQDLDLQYLLFYGSRYNHDYHDYGGSIKLSADLIAKYLNITTIFQPFYDSDLGLTYGYSAKLQTIPLKHVGIFGGVRNIPEYRDPERRVFGGIVFNLPQLILEPEISTPLKKDSRSTTRLTVNFIYKSGS